MSIKFCAFADIHYYPGVFPHDSVDWLDTILDHAAEEKADFIIHNDGGHTGTVQRRLHPPWRGPGGLCGALIAIPRTTGTKVSNANVSHSHGRGAFNGLADDAWAVMRHIRQSQTSRQQCCRAQNQFTRRRALGSVRRNTVAPVFPGEFTTINLKTWRISIY